MTVKKGSMFRCPGAGTVLKIANHRASVKNTFEKTGLRGGGQKRLKSAKMAPRRRLPAKAWAEMANLIGQT